MAVDNTDKRLSVLSLSDQCTADGHILDAALRVGAHDASHSRLVKFTYRGYCDVLWLLDAQLCQFARITSFAGQTQLQCQGRHRSS